MSSATNSKTADTIAAAGSKSAAAAGAKSAAAAGAKSAADTKAAAGAKSAAADPKKGRSTLRGAKASVLNNKDVVGVFNAMCTQDGELDLAIIAPKYAKIRNHVERYIRILEAFRDSRPLAVPLLAPERASLGAFVDSLRSQLALQFCAPAVQADDPAAAAKMERAKAAAGTPAAAAALEVALEAAMGAQPYGHVTSDVRAEFCKVYRTIGNCPLVVSILNTCKNCTQYRAFLRDPTKLSPKFLLGAGSLWAPLDGLKFFNIKRAYNVTESAADRSFILSVIHKIYSVSHAVYEALSEPDLDVRVVTNIIRESIAEVRKIVPRCNEAFDCITNSTELLEKNFTDYFKDFTSSGNPSIIMEHYVRDVAKSTEGSPKVVAQFNKIMTHYKKATSSMGGSDPTMNALFTQVNDSLSELEDLEKQQDDAEAVGEFPEANDPKANDPEAKDPDESDDAAETTPTLTKSAKKRQRLKNKAAAAKAAAASLTTETAAPLKTETAATPTTETAATPTTETAATPTTETAATPTETAATPTTETAATPTKKL